MISDESTNIPEGWESVSLGDVIELKYGKSLIKSSRDGGKYSVYGSNGIVGLHSDFIIDKPCLVVGRKGSIGEVHLSEYPCWAIDTTYYIDELYEQPISFWFHRLKALPLAQLNRASAIPGLNREDAYKLPITLPPLNEQRRIVAKIEALKARSKWVKEALDAIPPLLDQFRQSVLAAAFRGDLTANWREKKPDVEPASVLLEGIRSAHKHYQKNHKQSDLPDQSALPEIPSGWLWVTVEHLGVYAQQTVLTGPFGATLGREDFLKDGVPVITIGCLQSRGLDLSKAMYISQKKAAELERYKLKAGDFLFSRMASVGRAAIVEGDLSGAIFNYHLMRLRLSRELIEAKYFLYYVRGAAAVFQYVKDVNHGATRDGINTQQLSKMPVALPPIEEQCRIVQIIENYFDRTHNIDDFVSGSLEELQVCNQSILSKAFRGELVPQDPNDEPASVLLERIRTERVKRETEAKAAKKSTGNLTVKPARKAKQQDLESIQLGLPGVE